MVQKIIEVKTFYSINQISLYFENHVNKEQPFILITEFWISVTVFIIN